MMTTCKNCRYVKMILSESEAPVYICTFVRQEVEENGWCRYYREEVKKSKLEESLEMIENTDLTKLFKKEGM